MRRFGRSLPTAESTGRRRLALVPLGLVLGVVAELSSYGSLPVALRIADFVVGFTLLGCGTMAQYRRPESRVGLLLALSGFAWFLGNLAAPLAYLYRGPLVHLLLSFPTGRLRGRVVSATIAFAYLCSFVEPLGGSMAVTLVLAALVAATATLEFARSAGAARKAHAAALAAALAFAGVLALGATQRLVGGSVGHNVLWAYDIVISGIAVGLVVDLLRGRWNEAVVTGLVVDLGAGGEVEGLRGKLARALGDPSLVVGYRLRGTGVFIDDVGRPVTVPEPTSTRKVTPIDDGGEKVALLIHDEGVLADPALVDSVAAAVRIAVANARLEAEAQARALELEASRRRIVETADSQRRRLGAELRRGAERRLGHVAALIAEIGESTATHADAVAMLDAEVAATRREIEEFAQGVHPATLTEGGLISALAPLAERSPIPVELNGGSERFPRAVEAALFFVCSEALANVAKHAAASSIRIDVRRERGRAVVAIVDDGVGDADSSRGSGLRGLQDRIDAFGGRIQVESPAGVGTRLLAEIPIAATERGSAA